MRWSVINTHVLFILNIQIVMLITYIGNVAFKCITYILIILLEISYNNGNITMQNITSKMTMINGIGYNIGNVEVEWPL